MRATTRLRKDAQPMHARGREAAGGLVYARHRAEETQLYRLVEQHYPAFVAHLAEQGKALPAYVEQEFGRSGASLRPRH